MKIATGNHGLHLSTKAIERYFELIGAKMLEPIHRGSCRIEFNGEDIDWWSYNLKRDDLALIQVIEELGKEAQGGRQDIYIVEIPDDVEWHINSQDECGNEYVAENHRTWYWDTEEGKSKEVVLK